MTIQNLGSKTTALDLLSNDVVAATGNGSAIDLQGYEGSGAFILSAEAGDIWFGNWSDCIIGYWSSLDLLVDPYTHSSSGTIRITALQDVDVAFRHAASFSLGA